MSKASEASLAARAQHGDVDAFSELVVRYHGAIFNLALRMLNQSDEAEGVTQTAFVKAYERLADFDPSRRFFSWVYRIAVNESIDRLGRRKHVSLDADLVSGEPTPEEDRQRRELEEKVGAAIQSLPPELRVVIVMRHFEELSYRTIGEVLGVPEKTVKSRLYTARRRLADGLVERGIDAAEKS